MATVGEEPLRLRYVGPDEDLRGAEQYGRGASNGAEYCKHAELERIDNWGFYLIYNMFRSAAIIQGVFKRGLDGNASSEKALEYKDEARTRSDRAWEMVEEMS